MPPKPDLIRQFGLLSFVSILLIAVLSGYSISSFLTAKLLSREATLTAEFIDSVVGTDAIWLAFEGHKRGDAAPRFEYFFRHLSQMPGVVHANIYAADRSVQWATDISLIGREFEANDELDEALGGALSYETGIAGARDGKEEHQHLDDVRGGLHFVEIYMPVWNAARDRVLGVVELYKEPRELDRSIVEAVQLVWFIALASAGVLFSSLFWVAKRVKRVIDEHNQRLVETESLSMIGETASAVAHAMRNPLASIRASAELTLSDDLDGARESARDIINEADRLDRWARDLLQFSRAGGEQARPVDVAALLAEVVDEHRGMVAARRQELYCDIAPGPLWVRADATPLAQVFGNLLVNAVEAMGDGGRLELSAGIAGEAGEKRLRVAVRDTGGGLPESMRKRLFKPFATSKPQGTGLGLALSQRLVRRYGGELALEDRPGDGVTAIVTLPVGGAP